jgi:hypothetical protein
VFDGERAWTGANLPGLYYEFRELQEPDRRRPWAIDATSLGPVYAEDFEAFLAAPRADTRVERLGREEIVGIQAVKVRIVSTIMVSDPGSEAGEPGSDVTYWVDPERMLILKFESRPPNVDGLVIWAEVTKLEYGERQAAGNFVWVPVPGAIEAVCKSQPQMNGVLPKPFISFPMQALPAGWGVRAGGMSLKAQHGDCGTATLEFGKPEPDGETLLKLTESVEGPAGVVALNGAPVDVGGVAVQTSSSDGWLSVAWADADLGVQLSSPVLTLEELVALAKAMVAAP